MTDSSPTLDVEELLAQRAWLRRLACAIVGDSLADDVVQETWVAALAGPPRDATRLRAWLGRVARHFAWRHLQGERRRGEREDESAREEALVSPDELLACIDEQHVVARCVASLAEPYRSTVLWRYYDELSISEIARRTGTPESTVRTRVQRGLERVRERLGVERGPDWRLALLPTLKPLCPTVSSTVSPIVSPTGAPIGAGPLASLGGLLMSTQAKLLVSAVALAATLFLVLRPRGEESHRGGDIARSESASTLLAPPVELTAPHAAEAGARVALDAPELAPPPAAPVPAKLSGVVLDTSGRPLADVPLLATPTSATGSTRSPQAPLSPQSRSAPGPELPRPVPRAPISIGASDADGRFEIDVPGSELALGCGAGFVTLYSAVAAEDSDPEQELFLVAAPAVSLSGRVTRADGSPLEDVSVGFQWWSLANFPRELDAVRVNVLPHASTDADGGFALSSCPGTRDLELFFRRSGYAEATLGCPPVDTHGLLVTLAAFHGESAEFRAVVVDEGGAALPGALVSFAGTEAVSDERGEVTLPWSRGTATLVAVRQGKAPFVREGFGFEVWEAEGAPDPLEIELPGAGLTISGRVFDAEGRAAAGIPVTVERGTFISGRDSAEMLALRGDGSSTLEMARTDEDGRFVLAGLVDKEYVVTAYDAETLACVRAPLAAGSEGVALRFPANGVLHDVEAICVDTAGTPLSGLEVGLMLQVTYGQDGQLVRSNLATTDAEGRFQLDLLPVGNAWVSFRGAQILDAFIEVTQEDLVAGGPLRFVLQRASRLRFLPSGKDPEGCQAGLERADGTLVSLWVRAENTSMFHITWDLSDGASPIFSISEGEYTLLVLRDGEVERREAVSIRSGAVNELVLP